MRVLTGHLYLNGDSSDGGLRVKLRVDDDNLTLSTEDDQLGTWPFLGATAEPLGADRFRLTVGNEDLVFVPDDPVGFKYEVMPLLAAQSRLPRRGLLRRRRHAQGKQEPTDDEAAPMVPWHLPSAPKVETTAADHPEPSRQPESSRKVQEPAAEPAGPPRPEGVVRADQATEEQLELARRPEPVQSERATEKQGEPAREPQREQRDEAAPGQETGRKTKADLHPVGQAEEPTDIELPAQQSAEPRSERATPSGRPVAEPDGGAAVVGPDVEPLESDPFAAASNASRPEASPPGPEAPAPQTAVGPPDAPRSRPRQDLLSAVLRPLRRNGKPEEHDHTFAANDIPGGLVRLVCTQCGYVSIDLTDEVKRANRRVTGSLFSRRVKL